MNANSFFNIGWGPKAIICPWYGHYFNIPKQGLINKELTGTVTLETFTKHKWIFKVHLKIEDISLIWKTHLR